MSKRDVLKALIDKKRLAIISVLIFAKEEMVLKEISNHCNVPLASTYRILQEFIDANIISKKQWKTSTLYQAIDNSKTKFLKDLLYEEFDGIQMFLDNVKGMSGIDNIILHGKSGKGKANLMIIGSKIDINKIQDICNEIKQKGTDLSFLTLTKEQYDQMSKMGLYSGQKQILL